MRCVDVNVLVYAHRKDVQDHDSFRSWLEEARGADEPLGLIDQVLTGFVRVVTHPRVFATPTPLDAALDAVDRLRESPSAVSVGPGRRHREIFGRVARDADARGSLVHDAFLAAIAIEHGATFVTTDRDFARFSGLRWRHPLAGG
ncbi:MAG: type II toxin-antitoxin system VapC family toxin [Actinomycetota bacterium]